MNSPRNSITGNASARWVPWATAAGVVLGIVALVVMLLPGPGYRLGVLDLRSAFGMMRYSVWFGGAAVVISLTGLVIALFTRVRPGRLRGALGMVLGLTAIAPPLLFMQMAKSVPPIHDISTDMVDPPQFQALLAQRADAPNPVEYGGAEVAAQQHAAYPDIAPLQFHSATNAVFDAALATAQAMGWQVVAQSRADGRIEATATTPWFGFKDDVAIRIELHDGATRLDIRSVSRVGKSDVGANAARIRDFRRQIEARL